LGDLAGIALDALAAYRRMKLAVPDAMRVGLTTLASVLPCHAGTCVPTPETVTQKPTQKHRTEGNHR
jgi:hypothetical protein